MRTVFVAALLLAVFSASPDSAQNAAASPPSTVTLAVRVEGGQSTFHIGEIIPLELAFTSTSPKTYQFDNASYDRSGRLNEESFAIEPAVGWDDPLDTYFHSYTMFMAGGLRSFDTLSARPIIIHLDLNEWIRFKALGRYKITVTSDRVFRGQSPWQGGLKVTSNELIITIIPATKAWQTATLKTALVALDGSKPTTTAQPSQTAPQVRAAKVLRYLGTPEAAREMARRLTGTEWDWDFTAGLAGSPAKEAGLEEMKKLLVAPDFPVTDDFLRAMSVVSVPDYAGDARPAEREKAEKQFRQDLAAAIGDKVGKARAVSASTIVENAAIRSFELPDMKRQLTRALIADFTELSLQKQVDLIQYRWEALDHEEMLPLLRTLATRYCDFSGLREMNAYQFNGISASALQHWYEMAPDEARPVIIQEILRPKPRFSSDVLGILPDKELPEVEQALAERLKQGENYEINANLASLIERYATSAIEARVINFLDPVLGKLDCATQAPLLAYILRVDAEGARPRLEAAMAARGEGFSACNHLLLPEVAKLHNDSVLEDIAIKSLQDADPQVMTSSAVYLKDYGSAAAEEILWSRFFEWSSRWKGRESELEYKPGQDQTNYEGGVGTSLLEALASGQAWLADEAKLKRLVDLSVGQQQRQQAQEYLRLWRSRPWTIEFSSFGRDTFQIAQYQPKSLQAAKDKLLQFPRGSAFEWTALSREAKDEKVLQELSRFGNENGLRIIERHDKTE